MPRLPVSWPSPVPWLHQFPAVPRWPSLILHCAVSRLEKKSLSELWRHGGGRKRQRYGSLNVLAQDHCVRSRHEPLGRTVGRYLIERGNVIDDSVHLVDKPAQLALTYGELGQLSHMQDIFQSYAHALSHSRSSPA